ncbi:sel1 repeat family protein, partial [Vibrio anguillarum]|nr:sel1 repeat family protein [Vibrio anguillarum]
YYTELYDGDVEGALKWINKAIQLGYPTAARVLFLAYDLGKKDKQGNQVIRPNPQKAYYYNKLSGALGGEEETSSIISTRLIKDGLPVSDENGEPVLEILVTEQEQAEMDK